MSKFEALSDKALSLVGQAGDTLRQSIPTSAEKWLQTGAALGAARAGTKIAGTFARRNPAVIAATVIGAGLVWVAARQYKKRKESGAVEGSSRRIEPKGNGAARKRATTRRTRTAAADTSAD